LVVDHACPVCDQPVGTLPPPLAATDLTVARDAVEQARTKATQAREVADRAAAALTDHDRMITTVRTNVQHDWQRLGHLLPGLPEDRPDPDLARQRIATLADNRTTAQNQLTEATTALT